MSIRIFPDFVVATVLRDAAMRNVFLAGQKLDAVTDKAIQTKVMTGILIEINNCLNMQERIAYCTSVDVFVAPWDKNDYVNYFNNSPYFYRHYTNENPSFSHNVFYELDVQKIEYKDTLKQTIQNLCVSMLTEGSYSPIILRQYGFV